MYLYANSNNIGYIIKKNKNFNGENIDKIIN